MLHKLLLNRPKIFFPYQLQSTLKYCTHHEAIESILRSELRIDVDKFLNKNSFLLQCQPNEMRKSIKRLKRLNFRAGDIQTHPRILLETEYQLLNNFQRLREVGFKEVTAYRLVHIKQIMSKSVHFNQCFNFLPKNINIFQHIFATANIPLKNEMDYDTEMELEAVHRMALRNYMLNQIKYKDAEIDSAWRRFPIVKRRSLQTLAETAKLLEKIYHLPVHKLPKHLLALQPEEINKILNADSLKGLDVKKIMRYVESCNLERLEKFQILCESYKIDNSALKFTPKLFSVTSDSLKQRADKIGKLKNGEEFLEHIAIGRLILGMKSLEAYAESKQIDFDSIFTEKFIDFYFNGYIMQKDNATMLYLCNEFKKGKDEIQKALQVHPHWKKLRFSDVHANIEYLLSKNFTHEDIFNDLPIILYSTVEIKAFFNRLRDPEEMKKFNIVPEKLKKSQTLQLCIYFIEKKCNFNNEGIFLNADTTKYEDDQFTQFEEILKAVRMY